MKPTTLTLLARAALVVSTCVATTTMAAPTEAQRCEAAYETAAGKHLDCRLKAEATFALTGDAGRRGTALTTCGTKLSSALDKALLVYGPGDCPATPTPALDGHLVQCTDDVTLLARGGTLPSCGDAAVNATGEQCDGSDLAGRTCAALGFSGGTLACDGACHFDASACTGPALPATGQTTCWSGGTPVACAGTGQDGDVRAGAALAYQDNGNGTITDLNTGLTWEKKSDDGGVHDKDTEYSWSTAPGFIASLNAAAFGGHTDWRLPNVRELASLADFGRGSPAIDPIFHTGCAPGCTVTACSCTNAIYTWSNTTASSIISTTNGLSVNFQTGAIYHFDKAAGWPVRAVRGGV